MEYAMKRVAAGANLPTSEIWATDEASFSKEGATPKVPFTYGPGLGANSGEVSAQWAFPVNWAA